MTAKAKVYINLTILAGFSMLVLALSRWESADPARFAAYLAMAIVASGLKVKLPGIHGTMSVNFLFFLIAIVELKLPEALLIGCAGAVVQCLWRPKSSIRPMKVLFSVASIVTAIMVAHFLYHVPGPHGRLPAVFLLLLSACTFFLLNTFPVAFAVALTEGKSFSRTWRECYFWSFPYYLIGAAIAGLLSTVNRFVGWHTSVLILPVIYWIYRSYNEYLGRLEAEKKHAEEMANLHLRTIEALALAIEAKDYSTHRHLRRVGIYAVEIGKELGLPEPELQALRAGALLHDIGKLAVPEHIISKPGKLSPIEYEKMKIHPVVGAEILERVAFPYPVVPIVRCHHEKWDGTGYPAGLKGEEIPIGARILSTVDCLDALASDRQYRRALPLEDAMDAVARESGKSFDPRIVEILERRFLELEQMVRTQPEEKSRLSKDLRIVAGSAPAAGYELTATEQASRKAAGPNDPATLHFLSCIADARQEAQALFELTQSLGNSLSLNETLSVLALRLKRMIPFDSIAIYVRRDNRLVPEYVSGQNFHLFSSLEIPVGEGLSGWVALNKRPIINGNPSVEPGYLNDPNKFSTLGSALAVPLEGVGGVVGVLTVYHSQRDFFTNDHLRMLLAITEKVALSVENALRYRLAEDFATTDSLTGLPNARSLFLHLDAELARSKRTGTPLSVLVCDLDGFKQINDRYGHLEGNKVLRSIAQGFKDACREYDYVARMGGDEFVVVLPGHQPEAVESKCGRLAEVAIEAGRRVCGDGFLSLSVGAAFFPHDGTDAEQLLAEADRRMYKAKQQPMRFGTQRLEMGWQTMTIN